MRGIGRRSLALLLLLLATATPAPAVSDRAGALIDPGVPRRLLESNAPVKVWIFLADKGADSAALEAAAVAELRSTYPARAVLRRELRRTAPGLFDARDLPVAARYVAELTAAGAQVHVTSRWLNSVSATVDGAAVDRIAALPFVTSVRLVGRSVPPDLMNVSHAPPAAGSPGDALAYGASQDQLDLIHLTALHAAGFTGAGVVVGILDTGFVTSHAAFHAPGHALQVVAAWDFLNGDGNVGIDVGDDPDQHFHGTFILGELAAYLPGTLVGAAFDAHYILAKTEDSTVEVPAEEDFYVAGLEFIEQNGGDVATSSLGYLDWYTQAQLDGHTAVTTQAVNVATANGLYCVTAAGNQGHDLDPQTSHLMAPGDALQVITCGAVEVTSEYASFTSDGPTADGRVKPEVMAMGKQDVSVWPYNDVELSWADGTSTSTPLVAGVVACLAQALPTASIDALRTRLTHSSSYLGEPVPDPAVIYGWGILDALKAWQLAGTWTAVGTGTAGVAGVPQLAGSGTLIGTEPVTLAVTGGKPNGVAFQVIGLSQLNAAFKGGTMVPALTLVLPGLPLSAAGALSLNATWPSGLPAATKVWFQFWIPDAAGPKGFAATKGLKATTP